MKFIQATVFAGLLSVTAVFAGSQENSTPLLEPALTKIAPIIYPKNTSEEKVLVAGPEEELEDGTVLCYEQLSEKAKNDIVSIIRDLPADQKTAMIDSLNIFKELGTYTASDLKAFLALAMDREKCHEILAEGLKQAGQNEDLSPDEFDKIDFQHPTYNSMQYFIGLVISLVPHLRFLKEYDAKGDVAVEKLSSFLYEIFDSLGKTYASINFLTCHISCTDCDDIAYRLKSMQYFSSQLLKELE